MREGSLWEEQEVEDSGRGGRDGVWCWGGLLFLLLLLLDLPTHPRLMMIRDRKVFSQCLFASTGNLGGRA